MAGEAEFQKAIKDDPEDAGAHYDYGLFLYEEGRFTEAEEELDKTLMFDENHAHAHLTMTRLYLEQGLFKPQYSVVHALKAYELQDAFEEEEEQEAFGGTLDMLYDILEGIYVNEGAPGEIRALAAVLLGRLNMETDILDDAAKWFYAFLEMKDDLPDAMTEAEKSIASIKETADNTMKDKSIDNDQRAYALFLKGIMNFNEGDTEAALDQVGAARRFASMDSEVGLKATLYYIQLVIQYENASDAQKEDAANLADDLMLSEEIDDDLKEIVASFKDELG
jgi:tetratricopeptide (TPR) repeat protein